MNEHMRVGHEYPTIRQVLAYSFGSIRRTSSSHTRPTTLLPSVTSSVPCGPPRAGAPRSATRRSSWGSTAQSTRSSACWEPCDGRHRHRVADRGTRRTRRAPLPRGVNSPVRAFRSVGRPPVVLERGEGPYVWDADGRRYLDYIGAWGPAIFGHAQPAVIDAVAAATRNGFALGATHPLEIELGESIRRAMPAMERLRFTSLGTEAVMSAIRVARAATGRDLVVKFAGAYHGHSDGLLVNAGSGSRDAGDRRQRWRS